MRRQIKNTMIRNDSEPHSEIPEEGLLAPVEQNPNGEKEKKQRQKKKVAVVILNWNGRNLLETFLPSVVMNTPNEYADIMIADNGSSDDSESFVQTRFPSVKWLPLDKNYGFAGGYNKALEQIDYPYVLLLNSDVETPENWLAPLVAMLESDRSIAAVMPKIRSYREKSRFEYAGAAGGLIDRYGFPFCRGRILNETETDRGQWDKPEEIFWASGAAMLIRKELYQAVGGLDEDYFAHMEEIDLCWRLKNSGYKIMVQPAATVYHWGGATLNNESPKKLFLNFRNSLYTLYKNLPDNRLLHSLLIRMCMDGGIAILYLLQGKPSRFAAVCKAHRAFYKNLPALKKKRKNIPEKKELPLTGMLNGSLLWKKLRNKI